MVNGSGPVPARFMVIAQNPGRQEEDPKIGRPLYEKAYSGRKTREDLMPRAGVDPATVRFENVARCRPPRKPKGGGDFPPTPTEAANCAPYLHAAIEACRPEVIITLGAPALKWFFPGASLEQVHGQPLVWWPPHQPLNVTEVTDDGRVPYVVSGISVRDDSPVRDGRIIPSVTTATITVWPMYHPAAAGPGRSPRLAPVMLDDWSRLGEFLENSSDPDVPIADSDDPTARLARHTNIPAGQNPGQYSQATGLEVARLLRGCREFAFDFETTDPTWNGTFQARRACPIGYSVSVRPGHALYTTDPIEPIREFLEDPDVRVFAHNAKFEETVARNQGIKITNLHDTKGMAYVLRKPSTHLKDLSWSELGIRQIRYEEVRWDDPEHVAQYGAGDSDMTLQLAWLFIAELEAAGLWDLYNDMERPNVPAVAGMEMRGIKIDPGPLARLTTQLSGRIVELEEQLVESFGYSFNFGSPQQLARALFGPTRLQVLPARNLTGRRMHDSTCTRKACIDLACAGDVRTGAQIVLRFQQPGLGLPVLRRTGAGEPATDMDTLRMHDHTVVDWLVEMASAQQVLGKECRLAEYIQEDGRVHTSFHQFGDWEEKRHTDAHKEAPVTGRFSSSGPPVQNIVHHGDTGRPYVAEWASLVRQAFVAERGRVLMKVDVGQEEPRIGSVLAQCPALMEELTNGDVYRIVAGWEFKKPPGEINKEERQIGKRGFMAWLNGAGASGIRTSAYWLTFREAWEVIRNLRRLYPEVEIWRQQQVNLLKDQGYVATYFGRRIYRPEVWGGDQKQKAHAIRSVAPDEIQGTAADILKLGMVRVEAGLPDGADMVLTEHDEIVVELLCGLEQQVAVVLAGMVEGLMPIQFPLDVLIGPNWYNMEDYHD